jgi:8-oxo-dGTP pyrophosphatase MutT (NUDIX family)
MHQSVFRVGFSGHQQLGNEATIAFVSQGLRELLTTYQEQTRQRNQELLVYSALAPGADQLFIKTALELDIPVEAVIPCAQYEEIFTSAEALSEYHHLLTHCRKIHQLPAQTCSDQAYLEAGQWIVTHSDLLILVWNGYPAGGRGGTADVASFARALKRPFIHVHTRLLTMKQYGSLRAEANVASGVPRREQAITKQTVYQGEVLTVNQYRWQSPNRDEIVRDIVERPESVLVLPIGQKPNVLLIEEYDLGAGTWQLTLPGGKVDDPTPEGIVRRAELELREEIGYRPGRLEKLLDFYSHPGYMAHKVHLFVAHDLEWDPLELENGEEMLAQTFTLDEALAATRIDYRCDPEAALALWLYAGHTGTGICHKPSETRESPC